MKEAEIISGVHSSMYHQCQRRGYAAPVDVLMDLGVLPKQKYSDWRFGRVPFLEAVCNANLKQLSFILRQMRLYARKNGLKPSRTYYKQWGLKEKARHTVVPLRFSKSGNADIEDQYATHFVDQKRIEAIKNENASVKTHLAYE